jgi:hypothetical protein
MIYLEELITTLTTITALNPFPPNTLNEQIIPSLIIYTLGALPVTANEKDLT